MCVFSNKNVNFDKVWVNLSENVKHVIDTGLTQS